MKASNTWIIPISWMRNGITQPLVWLDKSNKIFPEMKILDSKNDWIILNVNVTGYYRVNYDQSHWKRLAKVLESDPKMIPAANRLQLISDAFALERFGYTEYDTPLYLTKYLAKEDDGMVWNWILYQLHSHNWNLIQSDYELYPVLKKYFLPRISPLYHHYASLLRQSLEVLEMNYFYRDVEQFFNLACQFGLRDCLDLASEIFSKWMDNPNHDQRDNVGLLFVLAKSFVAMVLKWEVKKNGTLHGKCTEITIPKTQYLLSLAALVSHGYFKVMNVVFILNELLYRFLHYALNESVISSYILSYAVENIAATEVGYWLAWRFITDNWSSLNNRYDSKFHDVT
ncbi:hypothetical protein lerEdw1_000256 [Lerista edwardsae]|nr:hypothetical protein lerEdw1_000256 [Lerista edwardsae]